MTKERKLKMIKWLKSKKLECEYKALTEMAHHGSSVYIATENEEAHMIEEIIKIVELDSKQSEYAHLLHFRQDGFPRIVAFETTDDAERYAQEKNIIGASLKSYQKYDPKRIVRKNE